MKNTISIFYLVCNLLFVFSCSNNDFKRKEREKSIIDSLKAECLNQQNELLIKYNQPEFLFQKLNEIERGDPMKYLSLTYKKDKNFFSQQVYIEGSLSNTAHIASFKDFIFTISYISQTNSEISSEKKVLYQKINPLSIIQFRIDLNPPKQTSKIEVKLTGAEGL